MSKRSYPAPPSYTISVLSDSKQQCQECNILTSVMDRLHVDADPDSDFLFDADPDPDPNFKKGSNP